MTISARVVADSISPSGDRLTTFEICLPRFCTAEYNTHRALSRNSASSRAIPVEVQIKKIIDNPMNPISWPAEQKGMSGGAELEGAYLMEAQALWNRARMCAIEYVQDYLRFVPEKENRLHKSVINRILEPYMWQVIVTSGTDWSNFWGLRCSPLAQPEFRVCAEAMRDAYKASKPQLVRTEEWHLPYIDAEDLANLESISDLRKVAVARCTRVSSNHAGEKYDYEKDFRLYESLISADPQHVSPLEHVATPKGFAGARGFSTPQGNFTGWHQLRHLKEYQ